MTNIVQVNVTQTIAPTPNTLQKTGALISQGATNTTAGQRTLLTQASSLTPILNGSLALSNLVQSGGLATATSGAPHGFTIGDMLDLTISGAAQAAYNGVQLCTITTTTQFTFAVPSATVSPATGTLMYTVEDVAELLAMVTTFFAQGSGQAVYVLELGAGSPSDGVAFLTAYIIANPGLFYSYLTPRTWDANANFLTMLGNFNSTTSKTYFFITTTLATWQNYTNLMKCVVLLIEAPKYAPWPANVLTALSQTSGVANATTTSNHGVSPGQYFTLSGSSPAGYNGTFLALVGTTGNTLVFNVPASTGVESVLGTLVASYYTSSGVPSTEFSHAADFHVALNYAPSSTNKVTPFQFSFLFGVTPFPTRGNGALLQTLQNAHVNVVSTGAEGGISDTILLWGTTMDGNDFNYWYSVDWVQINLDLNVSNAVINGSNNPINPLYYNQQGINVLQGVAAATMASGVSYGLVLGTVIQTNYDVADLQQALDNNKFVGQADINAIPFIPYSAENPSDYAMGKYAGLTAVYTPQLGFTQIVFNVNVTTFA